MWGILSSVCGGRTGGLVFVILIIRDTDCETPLKIQKTGVYLPVRLVVITSTYTHTSYSLTMQVSTKEQETQLVGRESGAVTNWSTSFLALTNQSGSVELVI